MNDENNDKPRGRGGKPRGDGPKRDFKRGGKPGFGDRKPGGKKPFAKRADARPDDRGDRPKRDIKRDDRPGDGAGRGDRPAFRKGPRPEREDGERRPFAKRADARPDDRGDRPKRDFKRDDRPRDGAGGSERPAFRKGPRPERDDGERKPFAKREGGDFRPGRRERTEAGTGEVQPERRRFRRDDRPRDFSDRPQRNFQRDEAAGEGGPKKPFRKEFRRDDKPFEKRAADGRDAGPRKFGDKPRSFGSKSQEGQKRSYGMKSHDGGKKPFRKPAEVDADQPGERIAKRLARAGIASRRDAEELIAAGRIKVNGQVLTSPAFNVMPDDAILLDGTEIPPVERTRLFLFHKPAGVVTTNRDPEGRRTVFDVLPTDLPRLMTVGRLDINTEGLLLLTNDGGLSRMLELPATGWLRRYRVRVHGKVEEQALAGLRDGIAVDGVFYGAIEAELDREQGTNAWLTIGLREGKNHEVKNILGALGLEVTRLIRVSYGPFQLGELPEGHVLEIKGRTLRDQLGERLIEESGANFDADIVKPFSNRPVRRTRDHHEKRTDRPASPRPLRVEEGGLIRNRKRDRESAREDALGRLSTTPERGKFEGKAPGKKFGDKKFGEKKFGDKKFGDRKPGGRDEKPFEPPKQRSSNVWMAPGARPQGKAPRPGRKPRDR